MIYYGNDNKVMREITLADRKIEDIPIARISGEKMIKSHVQKGHEDKKELIILFTEPDL